MQKQIASLLFQNKTCPLPGIGTLSIINSAAEADFTNKMFTAPRPVIHFVSNESDPSVLLDYLAVSTEQHRDDVTKSLEIFCEDLKKQAVTKLESIGSFLVNDAGNISFVPEDLPETFLQPVYAERVIRPDEEHNILVGDKETTNTVMTGYFNETPAVKEGWWIWAVILGVLCLLALFIYFTQLNGNSSFGNAIKI